MVSQNHSECLLPFVRWSTKPTILDSVVDIADGVWSCNLLTCALWFNTSDTSTHSYFTLNSLSPIWASPPEAKGSHWYSSLGYWDNWTSLRLRVQYGTVREDQVKIRIRSVPQRPGAKQSIRQGGQGPRRSRESQPKWYHWFGGPYCYLSMGPRGSGTSAIVV